MCLSAIYWARIDTVYFGATCDDAASIGFDDAFIYHELQQPKASRSLQLKALGRDEALAAFRLGNKKAIRRPINLPGPGAAVL